MPWTFVASTNVNVQQNTFIGSPNQVGQQFVIRVAGFAALAVRYFGVLTNVYSAPLPGGAIATTRQQWVIWRPVTQLQLPSNFSVTGDLYYWVPREFGENQVVSFYRNEI